MNIIKTETDPIVLCHGLFGSLSDPAMLSHFGERRILAPDLLGYGEYNFSDLSSLSLVDQAEHVLTFMDQNSVKQANLVGHSVGGAVAAVLAIRHPERVKSLISVEGNMSPPDAFWSASLAKKSNDDIQEMVDSYRADVAGWIGEAGVSNTPESIRIATDWLDNQPAMTLKAQASAVVDATSEASGFLTQLRSQLGNGLELHLVAGSRSRDSWHVPADIEAAAKSVTLIPDCGHLMMLDSMALFAETILNLIDQVSAIIFHGIVRFGTPETFGYKHGQRLLSQIIVDWSTDVPGQIGYITPQRTISYHWTSDPGISKTPFCQSSPELLSQQSNIVDTLAVHATMGGFSIIVGSSGVGKTVIRELIEALAEQREFVVASCSRTLQTYSNVLAQLADSFKVDTAARSLEKDLIKAAFNCAQERKTLLSGCSDKLAC